MPYRLELPDGSFVTVQDDAKPRSVALEEAKSKFPDAFPKPPGIGGQLLGAPKEFVKGIGSGLVQAVGGIGALPYAAARYIAPELKPFAETGFGKAITGAEQYLAPSDEGAITQVAGGLGSFASMFGPQALLRGVGATGRLATGLAPRAATPVAVAQTTGLGVEEARQRAEIARGEGINVTPGEELAALSIGAPIGLTELLPVEKLFRGLGAGLDAGFKYNVANVVKRAFAQGGVEGAQEVASGLLQDLSAKGIYNPNLAVGESMLGEFALGAGVGAIAQTGLDVLLRKDIQTAYNTRLRRESEKRLNDETKRLADEQAKQIAETKKNLGIADETPLALPAPAPKVEPVSAVDPLMNPVGYFNSDELTPEYLKAVNDIRDKEGKAKIKQFSVEDLVDAGAPKAEVDRLLTFKTGYDGSVELEAQDVLNVAQSKNVDVSTPGFADFLRRATGEADISKMSQPQLFSAFKALDGLAPSETLQILPQGTNATRFTQAQYDKSITNVKDLFPKTNLLGRSSVVQEIKDYSGLESDRDAESLLETAIRRGDLTTVSSPRFDVVDRTGKTVRSYLTRESAERAAAKEGLSVRESTSINIAIPGEASSLPGGPDIRKGTFQEGTAPESFEIRGPDAVLANARNEDEAQAKADRLSALRTQKAQGFLGQVAKIEAEMAKSQRKLESMEADGKGDTLEYKKLAAQIANNNKNLENQANRLRKKVEDYSQPLQIAPKGEKPVTRDGYTLFQEGKPVATFPNQQAAEEAALANLTDDQIQGIITAAPSQRGLMPQRLRKMAIDEQTRRRQLTEVDATYGPRTRGIEVAFKGDKEAAADRLRAAGVQVAFTPEVQAQIDDLSKKLKPIMDKLGLGELRLNIVKAIKTPMGDADGSYVARLITIAMDAANPVRTLRHEGIHALKELGAFTPEQWRVLENKAKSEWMDKYNIASRYKGLSQDEMLEEAISDAFSDFDQTKAPAGLIGALFRKIKQFMEAFGNGFRGMGFQSAEGIFQSVEQGAIRPGTGVARGERYALQEPKITGTGKIIGAPPGLSSEADRAKLVDDMVELLEHPFAMYNESKDWYERSGAAIREITRGNPELMERVVRLMSLYSQANQLGGNTTATIKSIAQLATGQDTAYAGRFPNETAKRIPAILAAKTMDDSLPGVDDKLMNFYRNLHDATYQTNTFADASTVDRWMMRLFGYPHAEDQEVGGATGVSKPQYIYAKDLIQRIADAESARTGETLLPRQVQAVLWTYVKNKTDYDSLSDDKKASFVPSTIDFNDYVVRATANITWESRPSTSVDMIPGIHTAPRQQQEAFNKAVREIFVDPRTGEDKIFKLLGNQQLYSSEFSMGAYENLIAPNVITKLVLQKDDGDYLTDVANNYAAIVGYVTKQDAVPWYRADPTASGKDASVGFRVTPSVEATPQFEEDLFNHLNKKMPGIGFTRVGGSFDFINFRGEDGKPFFAPDKKYKEKLDEALRTFAPDVEFRAVPFRANSGWISNDWKENPDGQGYIQRLRTAGLGDLQDTIDGWSKDYDQIAEGFGREYGWAKYSLRSDEPVSGSSLGSGISIRDQQPSAKSYDAVHYGRESVNTLLGSMYGTGIKGAEAARVARSPDRRVKQRAYFYIPFSNGRMPLPEAGLGNYVHVQRLNNLLGPSPEMQALAQAATVNGQFDENAFESSVIDAGYDGYAVPDMGMAVVLGADVPVIKRGTRQEVFERPADRSITIGGQKYSLRQTDTPQFKNWFGKSTITDERGQPKIMYHGTARDISEFRPKQANAIFVTDNPEFAGQFTGFSENYMIKELSQQLESNPEKKRELIERAVEAAIAKDNLATAQNSNGRFPYDKNYWVDQFMKGTLDEARRAYGLRDDLEPAMLAMLPSRANIMPLFIRAENPFDYQNESHLKKITQKIFANDPDFFDPLSAKGRLRRKELRQNLIKGEWETIESDTVQEAIKELGFDSFYAQEMGNKNLAVYDPNQIKSAIGNTGAFASDNNDIRYALALDGLQPQSRLIPNEGGNPDGNLGTAPSILESKPIRMLIGTHDDINDKGFGAKHILSRIMSDPRRTPVGTEEMLERIVKEAQRTAQSYTRIYQDKGRFILFNGRNSLVVSPEKDSMSIITMYKQTAPDTRYGNPVWQGRAPSTAEFLAPVRGMEVEAEGAGIIPKRATIALKRNVYTPGSIADLAAEVRTTKPGKITLKKAPEKYSLAVPKEARDDFFAGTEYIPESQSVEQIRSDWIYRFGKEIYDPNGNETGQTGRDQAYLLPDVVGGQEYIDAVQQYARETLGESFKGYRLMSLDEFEELKAGAMGSQLVSFALDPEFALKFANVARKQKFGKGERVVVEFPITPEHVQMIGSPTETEVVIDYGVGYNPDEVNGYASPVKFSIRAPETKEFKQWFGDSKVVDENGDPLVVYHGTQADIDAFTTDAEKANRGGNPDGFYFTPDKEEASKYAEKPWKNEFQAGANVMPVYLALKNPFNYSGNQNYRLTPVTEKMVKQFEKELREENPYLGPEWYQEKLNTFRSRASRGTDPFPGGAISSAAMTRVLKAGGFDGMIDGRHFVVFEPSQIKSAISNVGAFDVTSPDIRYSLREEIDPDTVAAIDRTTHKREEKGFIGRIIEGISPTSFAKFRQGMINKYEGIERLTGQVAKEFGSTELMADTSAIAAALFSDRAAGVAAASFGAMDRKGGIPVYRNGFTSVSTENDTVKGLIPILEPLAKFNDPFVFQAFQFYAGTRRGKRLTAEGREKLFTPDDIKKGQLLEQKYPEFKQVFDEYQKYNEGLVNFMKDTGVISDKEAQIWMQNADYIPFYRQMEGEQTVGPKVFGPIAGVAKPKKLKGSEAQLADFMETVVRNSRAAIEAGMKNVAAQRVARDMLRLNMAEAVPPGVSGADIITVKENGLTKHYRVDDPLLVESLKGLNLPQLPFLEVLAKPAEVLRNLVTKDPGFMLANLMRDSLQAWTTTGVKMTPIVDTFKQYGRVLAGMSPEAQAMGRAGLFGGYDFAGDVKATAEMVEKQLKKNAGVPRSFLETSALPLNKVWEMLDKGSHASDLATRAEVFKKTLAETGNEAEAAYQAMEVLNFSRKGNSALIRVVTALVPFMNARIQGLDVLYRAGWGKMASRTAQRQQKAFITRSLTLMSLSAMYWMLASETDEYKTAEPEARDNNWIIGNVRVPIPFEIGTVFKVFPERILEYFFGMDAGKDLKQSIARNITSTLAFNPIPQAFLPVVENVANYSFFTGQPIVGRGTEDLAKPFQVGSGTSILAQQVGQATGQSPMMIDNLIRGYTGTIGSYAVMALDSIMRGEGDPTKAAMRAEQMPVIKRFFASEQGTGTITAYYELKQQVTEATRTINFLERTGNYKDLQEYMKDKGAKLYAIKPYIQQLDKDMTRLREFRRAVQQSKIDPEQKRDILDNIRKAEVGLTSRIQYIKKTLD